MRGLMAAVAAMSLAGATAAAAEDEWQLADMGGGAVIGVEVSSIAVDGQFRSAAVMFVFGQPAPDGTAVTLAAVGFDCAAHTVAVIGEDHLGEDGALLSSREDGADAPADPILPGSLFHSAEDMVCRGERNPAGSSGAAEFVRAARRLLLQAGAR